MFFHFDFYYILQTFEALRDWVNFRVKLTLKYQVILRILNFQKSNWHRCVIKNFDLSYIAKRRNCRILFWLIWIFLKCQFGPLSFFILTPSYKNHFLLAETDRLSSFNSEVTNQTQWPKIYNDRQNVKQEPGITESI